MSTSAAIGKILIHTIPILIDGLRELYPLIQKKIKGKEDAEKIEQVITHLSSAMKEVKQFSEEQIVKNKKLKKALVILFLIEFITFGLAVSAFCIVLI
jgi:hypothetical protein